MKGHQSQTFELGTSLGSNGSSPAGGRGNWFVWRCGVGQICDSFARKSLRKFGFWIWLVFCSVSKFANGSQASRKKHSAVGLRGFQEEKYKRKQISFLICFCRRSRLVRRHEASWRCAVYRLKWQNEVPNVAKRPSVNSPKSADSRACMSVDRLRSVVKITCYNKLFVVVPTRRCWKKGAGVDGAKTYPGKRSFWRVPSSRSRPTKNFMASAIWSLSLAEVLK